MATENPEEGETRSGRLQVLLSSFWASLGGVFGGRGDDQEEVEIEEEEELDLEMASRFVVPEQPIGTEEAILTLFCHLVPTYYYLYGLLWFLQ